MSGTHDRHMLQRLYLRVCSDSKFTLPFDRAATFVSQMLGVSPLEIWCAFSGADTMESIAAGEHPACAKSRTTQALRRAVGE